MDSYEFAEWQVYEKKYSPGYSLRGDVQAATIAHVIAEVHRGGKGRRTKIKDFLIDYGPQVRVQTPAQMMAALRMWKAVADQQAEAQKARKKQVAKKAKKKKAKRDDSGHSNTRRKGKGGH